MSDFKPKPRPKTLLDDPQLKLYATPIEGMKKPTLQFYYGNNNPHIIVWTNVESDKDSGRITADMNTTALYQLLDLLQSVADDTKPDVSYSMTNENHPWDRGANKRAKDAVVLSKTAVGRDKEGRAFISLLSADSSRPKICFYFSAHQYHKISRRGEAFSEAEISTIALKGFINSMRDIYPVVAQDQYAHKEATPQGGSGGNGNSGGGGYNNRGGNQNNRSSNNDLDDDSLPF